MKNNEIIKILETFSKPELKDFGGYIIFNSSNNNKLLELYNLLKKFHPKYPADKINHQ